MKDNHEGEQIGSRKNSHIEICLNEPVEYYSSSLNGFSMLRFDHDALPELSRSEIDLSITLFGKKLAAPFVVGAMTGGTDRAATINRRLAMAAEKCGVGFALGSQRPLLKDDSVRSTYAVKEYAPKLPLLFGNLGAVQLNYGVKTGDIQKLIDHISADAFNFHLNPLQEAIQPEGDTNFSNLVHKLKETIPQLSVPVIFKEVGSGISEAAALKIKNLGAAGIETAGVGGTSWSKIEGYRSKTTAQKNAGDLFATWGIPTAESIQTARRILTNHVIIASGGIRNAIEIAKAIALGANAAAFALPLLKAAEVSENAAIDVLTQTIEDLRTVMFLVGAKDVETLQKTPLRNIADPAALTR